MQIAQLAYVLCKTAAQGGIQKLLAKRRGRDPNFSRCSDQREHIGKILETWFDSPNLFGRRTTIKSSTFREEREGQPADEQSVEQQGKGKMVN